MANLGDVNNNKNYSKQGLGGFEDEESLDGGNTDRQQ